MDLTLTIIEAPHNVNMINHTKAFPTEGGSLGRADNNFWVLPDYERVVSSKHADISFREGRFYLTDRSTNGTYHNQNNDAIGQDRSIVLNHGDILSVGDYRLKVSIRNTHNSSELPKGLRPADFLDSADNTLFTSATPAEHEQISYLKHLDDWLEPGARTPPVGRPAAWGTAGTHVGSPSIAVAELVHVHANDPLAALGAATDSPTSPLCIDPLAALDQASATPILSAPVWADEEDWWKVGSDNDHAPALTQAMHTPARIPDPVSTPVRQPEPPLTSSMWDDQPHLQNIAVTSVDEALGFSPSSAAPRTLGEPAVPPWQAQQQAQRYPQTSSYPQSSSYPPTSPHSQAPLQAQRCAPPLQTTAPLQQQGPEHGQLPQPDPAEHHHPAPQVQPATPPAQVLPDELARALGIENLPARQLEQLIPQVSAIVNETVNRLIDLLRSRCSIKNELRVQRTIIQMLDNNPLKFSASARDAIKNMFNSDNPGFMPPCDAVKASFDDLSDHQVAVLAGMRSGYEAMLKHFDPAKLDQRFNNTGRLLSNKKARNWEAFEQHYTTLKQDGESSYDLLFGDSFATTYEKQLAELKTARNLTQPGG